MSHRTNHFFYVILLAILVFTDCIDATRNKNIFVKVGQSIQKAIDGADSGDKIIVTKGVYNEQLLITKDDITLIGEYGAVLEPPANLVENACYLLAGNVTTPDNAQTKVGTRAGICIVGDVVLKEFITEHRRIDVVKRYIKNCQYLVSQRYGFLTLDSKNTRASHKSITSTPDNYPFIALCMDDKSDVEVWINNIAGYSIGLCVQTNGANVKGNHVEDSYFSVFVDPGIVGAKVRWNTVGNSAVYCGFLSFPASFGILVSGAKDTEVRWNYVEGINDGRNDTKTAVGVSTIPHRTLKQPVKNLRIAVYDFTDVNPPIVATGNMVRDNYVKNNEFDIQVYSTGAGNVAKKNICKTAYPAEACIA